MRRCPVSRARSAGAESRGAAGRPGRGRPWRRCRACPRRCWWPRPGPGPAAPASVSARAPPVPSEPMPVRITASGGGPEDRGGVLEQHVDRRAAEIHQRSVVRRMVGAARSAGETHVAPARRHVDAARLAAARRPCPRPPAGRCGSTRCSAKTAVKIGGMCWTIRTGKRRRVAAPIFSSISPTARGPPVEAADQQDAGLDAGAGLRPQGEGRRGPRRGRRETARTRRRGRRASRPAAGAPRSGRGRRRTRGRARSGRRGTSSEVVTPRLLSGLAM